jgi:hypothetical protein
MAAATQSVDIVMSTDTILSDTKEEKNHIVQVEVEVEDDLTSVTSEQQWVSTKWNELELRISGTALANLVEELPTLVGDTEGLIFGSLYSQSRKEIQDNDAEREIQGIDLGKSVYFSV